MKKYYPLFVFSLAAVAVVGLGYHKVAHAQDLSCEAQATRAYGVAVVYAQRITDQFIPGHIVALRRLHAALGDCGVAEVIAAADAQEELPATVERRLYTAQRAFNVIRCVPGEYALETEDGLACRRRGEPSGYEYRPDDAYPIQVSELYINGYFLTACTEIVSRESGPTSVRQVDMRFCTKMNVETQEIYGSGLNDSIDRNYVEDEVFAYVDEIRLDEPAANFVGQWMRDHCANSSSAEGQ